ncbi:MAG: hypothetical protein AB8C84_05490 [Oligoflexales bacterium]
MKWMWMLWVLSAAPLCGAVVPGERLLMLMDVDGDSLYGSAYFSVENQGETPEKARVEMIVPEGTVGVEGGHGLKEENVLWGHGRLAIEKTFPVGVTVINYLIKIPITTEELVFQFPYNLKSFGVAKTKGTPLTLNSQSMQSGLADQLASSYAGLSRNEVKKGEQLSVEVRFEEGHEDLASEHTSDKKLHVGERYLVLISADADFIYGQVYFAVYNETGQKSDFQWPILLPKETIDFEGGDGVKEEDLHLEDEKVILRREFPPGMTLIGIQFKTTHDTGKLTFEPPIDLPKFFVASPKSSGVVVTSGQMEPGIPQMLNASEYVGIRSHAAVKKGEAIIVDLHGLPEDRMVYWLTGGGTGLLLMILATVLTARSVWNHEKRDEAVIVNN